MLNRKGIREEEPFPDSAVADYFRAYVQTYVERDVLTLQNIRDMQIFDLILEYGGTFFPIEIKAKTNPNGHDARGIIAFRKTYPQLEIGPGLVVCACKESRWISGNVLAVPWNLANQEPPSIVV